MDKLKDIINRLQDERYSFIFYIIIIVLINLVGLTLYFRIDLTRNGAYSLSDVSKGVVSTLEEPLTVKVFFTKDLPAPYNSVHRYITDILEEYAQYGNRNFHYEFIDIEKNKGMAADFGIHAVQVRELKADQVKFRNAHMGLAIVHSDLIEKLPSITETPGLEYNITNLIKKMTGKITALQKLDDSIRVTLYASSNLPVKGMENIREVEDIVKKVSSKNYNKLSYKYIDPSSDKESIEFAKMYGLFPIKWPSFTNFDGRRINAGSGVIGIVMENDDSFETIQILSRNIFGQIFVMLDGLEDKINSAIDNLISINTKVGYITGHGEMDINNERTGAKNFKALISDMYEFKTIDLAKEDIPDTISTVIINGPKSEYGDPEIYKIDQFLMKGKSVLFLLDSFQEMRMQGRNRFGQQQPLVLPLNTGLEDLIAHYGVNVNRDLVLDLKCFKTVNKFSGAQDVYFVPKIGEDGLNSENVITKFLKIMFFMKSSSISIREDILKKSGAKHTVLVSSSDKSWLMTGRISYDPRMMRPSDPSKMKSHNLAVLLNGNLESYFRDREPPEKEEKTGGKGKGTPISTSETLKRSVKPARIIVVGTSGITTSNVVDKEGRSPNSVFLHNMVDYLSGNFDIPQMRTKGLELNPLEDTKDGTKLTLKIFNIAGLPVMVILFGFLVWRIRNVRKKRIMVEYAGEVNNE